MREEGEKLEELWRPLRRCRGASSCLLTSQAVVSLSGAECSLKGGEEVERSSVTNGLVRVEGESVGKEKEREVGSVEKPS